MFLSPTGYTLLGDPLESLAARPHRFRTEAGSKEVLAEAEDVHLFLSCERKRCERRACYLCEDIWDEECVG